VDVPVALRFYSESLEQEIEVDFYTRSAGLDLIEDADAY
jgi:hypothetical protein